MSHLLVYLAQTKVIYETTVNNCISTYYDPSA